MKHLLEYNIFESALQVEFDVRPYEYAPGKASPQIKKLVATVGGEEAGYITYAPLGFITYGMLKSAKKAGVIDNAKGVEMSTLFVSEKFRGLGLSHKLFEEFSRVVKDEGYGVMVLEAKDRKDNNMSKKELQDMYKRWGFRHMAGKYFCADI